PPSSPPHGGPPILVPPLPIPPLPIGSVSPLSSPPSGLVMTVVQDCRNLFPALIHFPAIEDGIHVTGLFVVSPDKLLDTSSPLTNDTNVPVSSLGGIAVHCDASVDQNSISRATCYVTIELPIQPRGEATPPAAYSVVSLAGNASANNKIIAWIPTVDAIS